MSNTPSNILRSISDQSTFVLETLEKQFGDKYLYAFNWFAPGHEWAIDMYKQILKLNKDVLAIETPLIGRTQWDANSDKPGADVYHRIGLNYVSSYYHDNYFIPETATPDRLYEIFEKTNTSFKPWRSTGDHIIYAMQIPEDTSLVGLDVFLAAQYDLAMLRTITDRPIYITFHPGCKNRPLVMKNNTRFLEGFDEIVEATDSIISEESTQELLVDAWCTVCYTSGTAFESVVAGIPAVTLSERSFVRPITADTWYGVIDPPIPERIPWLSRLAYCQWNLTEIEDGTFKQHVDKYTTEVKEKNA